MDAFHVTEHGGDSVEAIGIATRLYRLCFEDAEWSPSRRMCKTPNVSILMAWAEAVPVGFKAGYPEETNGFYSWLGGVDPRFRGRGVARLLLDYQHRWCRDRGFGVVKTQVFSRNRRMLVLNLRSGFEICAAEDRDGELTLKMEKKLALQAPAITTLR